MEYSIQELIDVATYGIVDPLKKLIALHPSQNDLNRALVAAAAFGKDHCVELLMTVADPKSNNSQAFRAAVRNNNLSCVTLLMPVSDANACNSEALRVAAANGFSQYVDMLLPMASPQECTQSLVAAVKHNHITCIEMLIPHLDQAELLKIMSTFDNCGLSDRLNTLMAHHQHNTLQQMLDSKIVSGVQRKM